MEALLPAYAELHCVSNFSFQRGASHPGELVRRAHELGYVALAITDECSFAGVVRAYQAWLELREEAKLQGRAGPALKLIVGSEFRVEADTPFRLVVLARNREGYGNLSEFITRLRRSSAKGSYRLAWPQVVPASLHDCFVLLVPDRSASFDAVYAQAQWLRRAFGDRGRLAVELLRELDVWERTQGSLAPTHTRAALSGAQIKDKNFDRVGWMAKYRDMFRELTEQARASMERAKKGAEEKKEGSAPAQSTVEERGEGLAEKTAQEIHSPQAEAPDEEASSERLPESEVVPETPAPEPAP